MSHKLDRFRSIPEAFESIASQQPNLVIYSQAIIEDGDLESGSARKWASTTYDQSRERIHKVSRFLSQAGVQKDTKVAIISGSRPEWMEADIASLSLGATVVSIYQSLPPEDIAYILFDSGSEYVFAENQEQVEKLIEVTSKEFDIPGHEDREAQRAQIELRHIVTFDRTEPIEGVTSFEEILAEPKADAPPSIDSIEPDDIAALVYTSGTTGPPKGVVQTHKNHLSNVRQAYDSGLILPESSWMLFLPLAHSFAKLVGYIGFLSSSSLKFPAIFNHASSKIEPKSVTKDIKEGSADIVPVVPRLLEKMRDGVTAKASAEGIGGKIIQLTLWSARKHYQAQKEGQAAPFLSKLGYLVTASIRKKIRETLFGPQFKFGLSGGAKLPVSVAEFFASLGIIVIEGYGLTETCVATNVNPTKNNQIGTVGPVLAEDIELRISDDDEILFRGPNVSLGYYNRPTATKASWDEEGWFHTGDLGSVAEDGFLAIVGRKKEIIVTSGGKNIAPHDIEELLASLDIISQAVLIGDGRKACSAVVTLNYEALKSWAKKKQHQLSDAPHQDSKVQEEVSKYLEKVNSTLAHHEAIIGIYIAPEEFSVENGFLTPTFKIKRNLVEKKYEKEIDKLYP